MTRAPSWLGIPNPGQGHPSTEGSHSPYSIYSPVSPGSGNPQSPAQSRLAGAAADLANSLMASLSAGNLSQASLSRSDQSNSSQSLGRLNSQGEPLQYKRFENTFLRRPLKIAGAGGKAQIQISILDLLNALGLSKASLKGSTVDQWKVDQWQRDIDLLIPVSDCQQSKAAFLAALAQCAPDEQAAGFLLNERTIDQGGSRFYKVQLGHPVRGNHRVDLVFAEKMDFKFDVLQASSEIEFDTQQRSASLMRVERESVLNWLSQKGLLFFNPEILGGVGRLSIYCSKGVTQLLQPHVLHQFVQDAEPQELSGFIKRQFQALDKMTEPQQQAFWLAVVECLTSQLNQAVENQPAKFLLQGLSEWAKVEIPTDLLEHLKVAPELYKKLSIGKKCGGDIQTDTKNWLNTCVQNDSLELGHLTLKLFLDVLGVRMVPPDTLLNALNDLPMDIEPNSPTLIHGILPALEYLKGSIADTDSNQATVLQLDQRLQILGHLPHRRCLAWLEKRPNLSLPLNQSELQKHLIACTAHHPISEAVGSSDELLFKIILEIERCPGFKKSNGHYRLIFDSLQQGFLDLTLPDASIIPEADSGSALSLQDSLLLFCKLGATIQRMAVERFAGRPAGQSVRTVTDLFRKLCDSNPDFNKRLNIDRKNLVWFKGEGSGENQLDWAWDHGLNRMIFVNENLPKDNFMTWCDGVESQFLKPDSHYYPSDTYQITVDGQSPIEMERIDSYKVWHCQVLWKVGSCQSEQLKSHVDTLLKTHQKMFGELSPEVKENLPEATLECDFAFANQVPQLNSDDFENSILKSLDRGSLQLNILGLDQYSTLILKNQQAVAAEFGPYQFDSSRKLVVHFADPDSVMLCHIHRGLSKGPQYPHFIAPFSRALGHLHGPGQCEFPGQGFEFSGVILGDQMIGPGVVKFAGLEHSIPLPSSLEGIVIPPELLEVMGLVLRANADRLNQINLSQMHVGQAEPLPEGFHGFVVLGNQHFRMRGYVANQLFVGEVASVESTEDGPGRWMVARGRFVFSTDVEASANHPGMALTPLQFSPVKMPGGQHLLTHGLVDVRICEKLNGFDMNKPNLHLGFQGYAMGIPEGQHLAERMEDLKLRISPYESPVRINLKDDASIWKKAVFRFGDNIIDDRVMFGTDLVHSHVPKNALILNGIGEWVKLDAVSTNYFKSSIILGNGLSYRGFVRISQHNWYPVPVGRVSVGEYACVFLKGQSTVLDSLASDLSQSTEALGEYDRILKANQFPLVGSETIGQLSACAQRLIYPLL